MNHNSTPKTQFLKVFLIGFFLFFFAKLSYTQSHSLLKIDYPKGIIQKDSQIIMYKVGSNWTKNKKKENKPRSVLKVGQILQIVIDSLPKGYTASTEVVFENDKMENSDLFGSIIGNGLKKDDATTPPANPSTAPTQKQKDDTSKAKEKAAEDAKNMEHLLKQLKIENKSEIKNSSDSDNAFTQFVLNKNCKPGIDCLAKSMEIEEVNFFLHALDNGGKSNAANVNGSNTNLEKALLALKYQQDIITYAQQNIDARKRINDSVRTEYAKKIDSLQAELNKLTPPKYYSKKFIGIQIPNSDYTHLTIQIKDTSEKIVNNVPLSFYNTKGFKIDFSTGIFNTFQKKYNYEIINWLDTNKTTAATDTFQIKKLYAGNNNISIGLLAHGYVRWRCNLTVAGSFGFSYSLDKKDIAILAGVTLLIGKEQRFAITYGVAYSKIKKLELYEPGKPYHKSYLQPNTDLKQIDNMQASHFIGISYNLGNFAKRSNKVVLN